MKAGSIVKMNKVHNYDKTDFKVYQCLIGKLMYLLYDIKPDIGFVVRQLSK